MALLVMMLMIRNIATLDGWVCRVPVCSHIPLEDLR
jgi:hypothetical protein